VICPDNAGLGRSALAAGEEVGGVAGMTAHMLALLDALEIERAVVAGWSMGGFVAQSLVREAPERVAALALISTHIGGPEALDAEPEAWRRLIDHTGTPREQATRLISLLFPLDRAADADVRFGDLVAAARAQLPERVLFMQEEALVAWHGRPTALEPIASGTPTVVLHGGLDTVVPPGNANVVARVHPEATVRIFEGCAHAPIGQEPEAVAEAILAVVPA
jgi:3-oxoadipate enol-lactonase